jgi:hypothetical protein
MTDLVSKLKEEKDGTEFRLEQSDSLIKCQKLELDTKASILKQLELRNKDLLSEINELKSSKDKTKIDIGRPVLNDKETQTVNDSDSSESESENEEETRVKFFIDKIEVEDLRMNLRIKESLIESLNDNLILKEAELARLKAKLSISERKCLIE